ncbi:G5 domain-containing protein [Demequina pelophila]|uniref:G5 domain-containing protein n=1 Tax=Demequina pelophila TaxID=1638984 RepID=UPI00078188E4|nr:G5 domain-containing protein [Demequina pelophila]
MSYRRTTPAPNGRREQRTRRQSRHRVLLHTGLGVAVASFAVGSIAAAAVPTAPAAEPTVIAADLTALPEIAVGADEGVTVTSETETRELGFDKIEKEDPNLEKGTTKVVTEGEPGSERITYDVTAVGGEEVGRTESITVRVADPIDEVVAIGTKEEPVVVSSGGSGSGGGSVGASAAASNPTGNRALGQQMAASMYGWSGEQWYCLEKLWTKESGWNHRAANPTSSAYGIPQSLPGSKMASAGADWATNPATQIRWGLGYIKGRYGTPCGAWSHSVAKNWY